MSRPLKYGLFLVVAIGIIIFIIALIFRLFGSGYLTLLISSFISSFLITVFIILTAPVLKDILATYRTMMRLENLSHPLLLELSLEAPGTYHHSLIVANLANRASKAIGCDSIKTRIGGYYHDIGKMVDPAFFVENQMEGENPHSEINNPKKSAKIIISHVAEGVKLAKKHNLPKEIIDLIEQHHGTTMVHFFYEKAKDKNPKVKKDDYEYSGPKPHSPEAAILMLSDAIEAKIRLISKITPLVIRETIDEIIAMRIYEKQLEFSGLSQDKIKRLRESFIETLSTMFHQRIIYPEYK
ncbi:hypothetical protein A3F08_01430 [Candidatus Berkelbacteria bacterium RIFCSPHIGHO2_12_FULL_36_9]|uniref:HD domain-containing protein n=1 Tax=Candidatus Berkelbacteria bacterium RIFCSPHIGHO2_12_FULL_36_9 TaxID=1797469 RepID=A0A1F5EK58_9BACT|nr:MAG: hypothetical protein A3F08_01430 [Candidatus Berkelbacteria bacterium RIFCSPHIGHO2_12_FULL_36_9]